MQNTPGLIELLGDLSRDPAVFNPHSQHMQVLEHFVVVMYNKGCGLERVNEARLRLFASGKKMLESLPPTQAALYQHIHRAMLQASFFLSQATSVHQVIPNFENWGWHKDDNGVWLPLWTTLEDSSRPVPSCCNAAARNLALENASATELVCVTPTSANVKVDV